MLEQVTNYTREDTIQKVFVAIAKSCDSLLRDKNGVSNVTGKSTHFYCWPVPWSKQNYFSSHYKGNSKQSSHKLMSESVSKMKTIASKKCDISFDTQNIFQYVQNSAFNFISSFAGKEKSSCILARSTKLGTLYTTTFKHYQIEE